MWFLSKQERLKIKQEKEDAYREAHENAWQKREDPWQEYRYCRCGWYESGVLAHYKKVCPSCGFVDAMCMHVARFEYELNLMTDERKNFKFVLHPTNGITVPNANNQQG